MYIVEIVLGALIVANIVCWTLQLRRNQKDKEFICASDLVCANLHNSIKKLSDRVAKFEKEATFELELKEIRSFIANQKSPVTKEKLSEETVNNYMKSIKAYLLGKELKDNPRNNRAMNLYKQYKERK